MENSDGAKKLGGKDESSSTDDAGDDVSDLKRAISDLEDVISGYGGEETTKGSEDVGTLDSAAGEQDPFAPRRTDPDQLPEQQEQTEQPGPYEQLGTTQEGRAVRGPRVRNAKTRRRRGSGIKTIRSDWGDVRSAKLASLSQAGPSASDDDEPVESRKNRIGFEEAREEGKAGGGKEMAAATIIARIISVGLFLIVIGSVVALALSTRKGSSSDEETNELVLLTQELNGVITQVGHAKAVLDGFWKAPNIEDKLQFVWQADRVRPLMKAYYQAHLLPTESNFESSSISSNRAEHSELPAEFVIASAVDHVGARKDFILRPLPEGYLVDWEASVGYNPYTFSKLINQRQEEPVTLRVYVMPASYYNYQYSDSRVFQSFALKVTDNDQPRSYAFARRDSAVCKELMRFFVNRSQRAVAATLRLRFPKGGDSGAELLEVVRPHWADTK